jgi:hypothetical protein
MPIVCPTINSPILDTNTLIDVFRLGSYQLKKYLALDKNRTIISLS